MHLLKDHLSIQAALTWADVQPTALKADLYNDGGELIERDVDVWFTSSKLCEFKNGQYYVCSTDVYTTPVPNRVNDLSTGIIFVQQKN